MNNKNHYGLLCESALHYSVVWRHCLIREPQINCLWPSFHGNVCEVWLIRDSFVTINTHSGRREAIGWIKNVWNCDNKWEYMCKQSCGVWMAISRVLLYIWGGSFLFQNH